MVFGQPHSIPPKQLPMMRLLAFTAHSIALLACGLLHAAEPDAKAIEFFEKRVRPLMLERCFECHNDETRESELAMDSRGGLLEGGTRGPAIIPGKPAESLLIRAVNHGELLKMPPKEKLSTREIADLAMWIKNGAVWPNSKAFVSKKKGSKEKAGPLFTDEQRSFWAFQKPVDSKLPVVKTTDWFQSPIDHFILAQLEAANLKPAPRAAKRTLIRRATFDLTGLPPSPKEIDDFLTDETPDAFARLIDRLLASPAYGERWGRHWLDVARYADSNGLDENLAHANAFRYRDYVVAAFNKDKPFDRFLQEQIAGDLLESASIDEQLEALTATTFLVLGAKMLAEDDPMKMQMDIIDEQIDVIGKAFMGLTLGCARCHDHKFDPIPQADYYSLAGIFKSTKTMENHNVVARWQERPLAEPRLVAQRNEHQKKIDAKKSEVNSLVTANNEELLDEARRNVGAYVLAAAEKRQRDKLLKRAKSFGADKSTHATRGLQLIEAENYTRGNVTKDFGSYGAGIGVLVNRGELPNFVEYDVEIPKAGYYQFELRYAAAGSRPCKLSINKSVVKTDAAGEVTGSWNPDGQKWFVEDFFKFEEGKNTIRLEHAQFFPHIDKLLFVPIRTLASFNREPTATAPANTLSNTRLDARTDAVAVGSRLNDDDQLIPRFIQQWAKFLETAEADQNSEFRQDARVLATRFQQADTAWRELKTKNGDATALANARLEKARKLLFAEKGPFAVPDGIEKYYPPESTAALKKQRDELKSMETALPKFPETMAVSDGTIEDVRIHIRGNHITQGTVIPRRMLRIMAGENQTPVDKKNSGRLQLAQWLSHPNHPMTPRVIVNRIWQWHFGAGLVRSPDNFGSLGDRPTHPLLLDWLASRFVRSGWSIKQLHRTLMLSSAYQMSTVSNEFAMSIDPDNKQWWRMNRRRLEAEAVRDSILAVCGSLNQTMGGSLLPTANRAYVTSTANVNPVVYEPLRRAVYLPVVRSALYDVFQAFDFAEPSVINGKRSSTTVASQALFMMNSKLVAQQTRRLAEELVGNEELDDLSRLGALFTRAVGRHPSPSESERMLKYAQQYVSIATNNGKTLQESRILAWQSICRAVLASNEFLYVE